MTKLKTKRQLFEFLDSLVEEEEIDEMSTSAGAGAYSTPNAFSSDKDSDGSQSLAKHAHDDAMVFNKEPNKSKKNTVKEAIQFHEKHPELAKTWGIIGPITDKKSALAMSLTYGKKAFTYNNKTYYLVPTEHHSKFKNAGFKQLA